MVGKTIGQINGPWALLLKTCLILIPLLVALQVWLAQGRMKADAHIEWSNGQIMNIQQTLSDEIKRRTAEMRRVDDRFNSLPPQHTRQRLDNIELKVQKVDDENSADHRVLIKGQERTTVILESIKAQLTKQNGS